MRVAVTGITGQFGIALARRLEAEPGVEEIVGVARRPFDPASLGLSKVTYRRGDVRDAGLREVFAGCQAVVHLAFVIVGGRDRGERRAINIEGSRNVFASAAEAGARKVLYASSIAAYGAHPDNPEPITEDHPTRGNPDVAYSAEKAEVEQVLDLFGKEHPQITVTRFRPGVVVGPGSGDPRGYLPGFLGRLPVFASWFPRVVPNPVLGGRLLLQFTHEADVAEAFRLALVSDAPGAFNLAGDGALGARDIASIFRARTVPVVLVGARQLVDAAWRLRLSPWPGEWVTLARYPILVDTTRAKAVLGWEPRYTSEAALRSVTSPLVGS